MTSIFNGSLLYSHSRDDSQVLKGAKHVTQVRFLIESYFYSIFLLNVFIPNYSIIVIHFRNYYESSLEWELSDDPSRIEAVSCDI